MECICTRLQRVLRVCWMRVAMRYWSTKVHHIHTHALTLAHSQISESFESNIPAYELTNEVKRWKHYTLQQKSKRKRLHSIINIGRRGARRYAWLVWLNKTRHWKQKLFSCYYLCTYGANRWVINIKRTAFSLWRTMSATTRSFTVGRLGQALDISLKKIMKEQDLREKQAADNMELRSRINSDCSVIAKLQLHGMKLLSTYGSISKGMSAPLYYLSLFLSLHY